MSHVLISPDGSSLVLADVFGVTRFALGKSVKVKHTAKVSSAPGSVSIDDVGATLYVQGRLHTGAYGNPGDALLGVPALGLREKFPGASGNRVRAIVAPDGVMRRVELDSGALAVDAIVGATVSRERTLDPLSKAAHTLAPLALGGTAARVTAVALAVAPDGRFVACCAAGVFAGRVAGAASGDEVWWLLPLSVGFGQEVAVSLDGDAAWVFVRDYASDLVRCVSVTRAGEVAVVEHRSHTMPAVSGGVLLTQPARDVVHVHAPGDPNPTQHDISAWNVHPADAPEAAARGFALPMATRLPGVLAASGDRRWFVPWHREFVVDLTRGLSYARGLDVSAGPFRRLLLERVAWYDGVARGLGVALQLSTFERHNKDARVSLGLWRSPIMPGLFGRAIEALCSDLNERAELATHGYRWSSFASEGSYATDAGAASLDDVRALLAWMRAHDVIPSDLAPAFGDAYDRGLGIPGDPSAKAFLAEGAGERMLLRASLETLAHGGWPDGPAPETWATDTLPIALVERVAGVRSRPDRYLRRDTFKMLGKMLARHLQSDAMPALLLLFAQAARHSEPTEDVRQLGEAITFVVHHHPEHQADALACIGAALASGATTHGTRYNLELTRERVARGARHFWSNA